MSIQFYCSFFNWIFFLMLSYTSCLYMLDINPLSVIPFANIFSHSVGCLFALSMFLLLLFLILIYIICIFKNLRVSRIFSPFLVYRMYVFCFSYPLLLNKPPQSLVAWSNNQYLFCLCICNLGRTQWNQLTSAPCSVCWGNSMEYGKGGLEDLLSRWCTCMTGKLVPPACQPGIQPGL